MPHLHIAKFKEIEYPNSKDGVLFHFSADNITHVEEKLISVSVEGDNFFLLVREEESRVLLKSDKTTRPASIYNVHKELLAYERLTGVEVISSNVPDNQKNIHLKKVSALKSIEYFASNFSYDKELRIEIGFGSGRHLLHQVVQNPEILFIGIEIHRQSIEQVLKQIAIQNIDNLLILDYDARLFMELIPSNIVGKIFVHFPVPWEKKPHRRVISTSFIKEANRVLKVNGELELRTDSEEYYAYAYETFINFNKTTLHINKNRDIAVVSKYEDRWRKMEKNIYDITMINQELSPELSMGGDFSFSNRDVLSGNTIELYAQTKRFEIGFVHFERVYRLNDGLMFRLSMGSFDKPEHLYVIVKNDGAEYFPSLPLRSKSNLMAHEFLCKALHG